MRSLTYPMLMLMALLAAPVALAQEDAPDKETSNETRPDDAAWVDDCPPDMMCAYQAPADDEPTYDGNCGGEVCAYGDETCIECSGPIDDGATCMDGADANETCRDDVQYIGGEPTRGPADGSCENCRGEATDADTQGDAEKAVPLPAAVAILAGAVAMIILAKRK